MGISGLLPALKGITVAKHVGEFCGKTACVDAYSWLHKGAYCCATEICRDGRFERCIAYCVKRVQMLQSHGVTPIRVFDGGSLPMKGGTEEVRRSNRAKNMQVGDQLYASGDVKGAMDAYN